MKSDVRLRASVLIVATFIVVSGFLAFFSTPRATASPEAVTVKGTAQGDMPDALMQQTIGTSPTARTYMNKISSDLRESIQTNARELTTVVVYTIDPGPLGRLLRSNGLQSEIGSVPSTWTGVRPIVVEVPAMLVPKIAFLESVQAVSAYVIPEPPVPLDPEIQATDETEANGGGGATPNTMPATMGHKATDAWALGYTGQGVKVAVMDSGVDFAHPDLLDTWAIEDNITSPYYNWPMAFDPYSMYLYMIAGLTYPALTSWYVDTNTNATPFANNTLPIFNGRWYNVSGITSASGWYHIGLHPAPTLKERYNHSPAILVTDSVAPYSYDTVYVDLNDNGRFDDDKPTNVSSPVSYADYRNATDGSYDTSAWDWGDGDPDMSGGLLYFIADGFNPVPYSDVISARYGMPVRRPGNGNLTALMIGDAETAGGSHGTLCASAIVAQNRTGQVQGFAPDAKVIAVGNIYLGGFWLDIYPFAIEGYDGISDTGDEASIGSSSYGFSPVDNDGWDYESRWIAMFSSFFRYTTFVVATGNGGPGFGTVVAPGGSAGAMISAGAATNYYPGPKTFWEAGSTWNFGDVQPWSNRGPSAVGNVAPDVVTVGAWAPGDVALNGRDVASTNGSDAWGLWGGTSLATPATAGALALIYDAYYQAHSSYPTNTQAREFIMNGAENIHYDSLIMGSGLTNALDSVLLAADRDGVSVNPPFWTPGDYRGTSYPYFAHIVEPGDTVQATFQLTNRNSTVAATANITDAVLQKTGEWSVDFWSNNSDESPADSTRPDYLWNASAVIPPGTHLVRGIVYTDYSSFDAGNNYSADSVYWAAFYNWEDLDGNGSYWNDSNGNGVVNAGELDQGEYMRFTFAYALTNVQNAFVHDPQSRVKDALLFGVMHRFRSALVPSTMVHAVLEFYQLVDSSWLTENPAQVNLAAGGTGSFTATLTVPPTTSVGVYSNMIVVTVNGTDTVIPVIINVAGASDHITFEEDTSDTSYYDNGKMYQGPDWWWRPESGDWRFYFTDIPDNTTITPGTRLVVHTSWSNLPTDIDTIVLGPTQDDFSNEPFNLTSFFGPYTLGTVGKSRNMNVGGGLWLFNTATGTAEEWVSAPAQSGLHEIALHNVLNAGQGPEETFTGETGFISVDPFPWSEQISTNTGTKTFTFVSTLGIPQGLDVMAFGLSKPSMYTSPINNDEHVYFFENVSNAGLMDIVLSSTFAVDTDLYLHYYVPGTGYVLVGSSTSPYADEEVKLVLPANGMYMIEVHGYYVPMAGATFDLVVDIRDGNDLVPSNIPVGPIIPGASYQFDVQYTTLDIEGDYYGVIFVGPKGAPTAIEMPVLLRARDTTPPNIVLHSPTPGGGYRTSTVPSIEASFDDIHGAFYSGVDMSSVRLLVDGRDVTSSASIVTGHLWWNITFLLSEGLHTADISLRDKATSPNLAFLSLAFTIDNTAPVIVLISPTVGITNQPVVNVSGYTDPTVMTVLINGQPTSTTNGVFYRFVGLVVGINTITIEATDAVGNTGYLYKTITLDMTPPSIIVTQPFDGSYLTDDSVEVIGTTEPGAAVTINGINVAVSPSGSFAVRLALIEGVNTITVTAKDAVNNQAVVVITVTVDTVPPPLAVTSPSSEYSTTRTVRVEGQAEPGATVTIDGFAPDLLRPDGYFITNITYPNDGPTTIVVAATDLAGNTATILRPINIDTVAPILTVTNPTPGLVVTTPAVQVTGTTEVGATVTISGQNIVVSPSGSFDTIIPLLAQGINVITIVAKDPAGNANSVQRPVEYDAPDASDMQDEIDRLNDQINNLTLIIDQLTLIINNLWDQLNASNDNTSNMQYRLDRLYENFTRTQNDLATLRANIDGLSNVLLMAMVLLIVMLFVGIVGLYISLGRKIDSLRDTTEEDLEEFEEEEERPMRAEEKQKKPRRLERKEVEEVYEEDLEDEDL